MKEILEKLKKLDELEELLEKMEDIERKLKNAGIDSEETQNIKKQETTPVKMLQPFLRIRWTT